MSKIKSVMLIDDNELDIFINRKILENYGIRDVISFRSANNALAHLKESCINYQLILVDIYMPLMDGFEFIDKLHELGLHKKVDKICLLTASLNPFHKKKAEEMNIKFIEKPLIIDGLLLQIKTC